MCQYYGLKEQICTLRQNSIMDNDHNCKIVWFLSTLENSLVELPKMKYHYSSVWESSFVACSDGEGDTFSLFFFCASTSIPT